MAKRSEQHSRKSKKGYFDYSLVFIIIFLLCFGLVMLYSTSSYTAQMKFGTSTFYLKRQIAATIIGVGVMFIASHINYHIYAKFAFPIYVISICAVIAVFFVGVEYNGSKRWLSLGGITVQPSELAKIGAIIFCALLISKYYKAVNTFPGIFKIFVYCGIGGGIVLFNNMSSAIIIFAIVIVMLFVANPKYRIFFIIGVAMAGIGSIGLSLATYRLTRIKVWLHPENYDAGYQTLQGLYAIGSGGLFGKGLGESMQKVFLPEAQNDMIFSIICEELGLFGAICVVMLFLLMIWRLMIISSNAKDLFGAMLVVGVMVHIALQVILNIAVVTNSMPNTGITLPFISYGGTSVVFLLGEMGIVLNVSKGIRFED